MISEFELSNLLMTDKDSVRYVPWKPHIERSDTNLPIEREEDKYQDIRGVTRKCNQQTKNKQLFVNTEPGIQRYVSETESVPAGEVVWLS